MKQPEDHVTLELPLPGSTTMYGEYTEHPVAALFPLLRDVDSDGYSALVRYPRQSRGLGFVSPSKGQEAGVA